MKTFYKKQGDSLLHWGMWRTGQEIGLQQGVVGDTATRDILLYSRETQELVEQEALRRQAAGYSELPREQFATVIIQHQVNGWGTSADLDIRNGIMDLMDECLRWTGLGYCAGGDIGNGTTNVFCTVVDASLARTVILNTLKEEDLLDRATLAVEQGADEDLEVFWPPDYEGKFSY